MQVRKKLHLIKSEIKNCYYYYLDFLEFSLKHLFLLEVKIETNDVWILSISPLISLPLVDTVRDKLNINNILNTIIDTYSTKIDKVSKSKY